MKLFAGLLSAVLGVMASFLLPAWGANSSFDVVPFQFGCAVGAVVVGIWINRTSRTPYPARGLATAAAVTGFVTGGFFLLSVGILWLLWPK